MGNSPSKNASPNTHALNNASLNSGSSSGSTSVSPGGAEPEPDDRKYSSSNNKDIKNSNNSYNTRNYNKKKLQEKRFSKSPKKFTYFNEFNNSSDDTINDVSSSGDNVSPFEMEINLSMAKALKPHQKFVTPDDEDDDEENVNGNAAVAAGDHNVVSTSGNNDEVSSSLSDLFTIDSSISSSLSATPPFSNLPPILEEQNNANGSKINKKFNTRKPKIGPNDVDIDSIIERLLTQSTNGIGGGNSNSSSPIMKSNNGKDEFFVKPHEISIICSKAREVFLSQPSLLRLSAPVKVVGDIHGQFNDLLRILKLSGLPPNSNYLFLGDYVDRGKQSLETILLLFCFKIKYPENFFMLRGNHESANITKIYGFYDECKRRLNLKSWKNFIDVFNTLPIAAVINDKIFCIHGGLSPHLNDLKQIEQFKRPTDIPETGLLADLLWSDPDPNLLEWSENDRGVSYCFGKKIVENFCKKFKFDLIIRGHMVVEDGYEFFAKKKFVTIFSAPNYCGEFNNWGAVMSVDHGLLCSFELLKPNKKA